MKNAKCKMQSVCIRHDRVESFPILDFAVTTDFAVIFANSFDSLKINIMKRSDRSSEKLLIALIY